MTENSSSWISHSLSFTTDLHPETNWQSLEISFAQTQSTTYIGNCILLRLPFPAQSIDPHRVCYSIFISNSERFRLLWQRVPWSKKVLRSLSVTAVINSISDKCKDAHAVVIQLGWACIGTSRLALNELGSEQEEI